MTLGFKGRISVTHPHTAGAAAPNGARVEPGPPYRDSGRDLSVHFIQILPRWLETHLLFLRDQQVDRDLPLGKHWSGPERPPWTIS